MYFWGKTIFVCMNHYRQSFEKGKKIVEDSGNQVSSKEYCKCQTRKTRPQNCADNYQFANHDHEVCSMEDKRLALNSLENQRK